MTEYLNKEQIKKYQQLYETYYGKKISEVEAYEQGMALVTVISTILKDINIKSKNKKNGRI